MAGISPIGPQNVPISRPLRRDFSKHYDSHAVRHHFYTSWLEIITYHNYAVIMKHAAISLVLVPFAALAQAPLPDLTSGSIASLEAGVICAPEELGVVQAPGTIAGTTHVLLDDPPFVAVTRRVPAVLGLGFGIKSLSTDTEGLQDVLMRVTHPAMGTNQTTQQTFTTTIRGTDPSLTFYQFDYDYELVPGIWQLEASSRDEVLYRKTFEVVAPDQFPELAEVCGYLDLLS